MSYGKPVLVSVGDGTEEDLVRQGKNGMVFRQGDYKDLSEKIGELLECPGRLDAMGSESLRIVREEININTMVHSFSSAVRSMRSRRFP
jgi:glycosyltransferase involved in cell wall biosynthesis